MGALILKGIVTGFILSIMLGPAFFLLLETSIRKGVRAALAFDAGVLISDLFYIIIAFVFYQEVSEFTEGENNAVLKMVGGIVFIIFGTLTYFKKTKEQKTDKSGNVVNNGKDYFMMFTKGFVLNVANPLVIFYWFSVIALGAKGDSSEQMTDAYLVMYLAIILVTFFCFDILKIFGAKKLRPFITDAVLKSLNRVTGSVLFIFGVFLVIQSALIMMK